MCLELCYCDWLGVHMYELEGKGWVEVLTGDEPSVVVHRKLKVCLQG